MHVGFSFRIRLVCIKRDVAASILRSWMGIGPSKNRLEKSMTLCLDSALRGVFSICFGSDRHELREEIRLRLLGCHFY